MSNLDFDNLRSHIEANTYLPEFREVRSRARRVKRRQRIRVTFAVIAASIPGLAAADLLFNQPPTVTIGITGGNESVVHLTLPTESRKPDTWTLVAADGIDLEHLYGLVDVCSGNSCDMEISSIDPGGILGVTQHISLFRHLPTDRVTDPRVVAVDAQTVIVSARVNAGAEQTQTLHLTALPSVSSSAGQAHVVQSSQTGAIQFVRGSNAFAPLPTPPPVSSPHLAATSSGLWVSGANLDSGEQTLAITTDLGRTWVTHPMGLDQIDAPPAIATTGREAYLLVSSHGKMALRKSTDEGQSWHSLTGSAQWPASRRYGILVAHDRSIIVWISSDSGTTLLRSEDGGATFTPYHNPGPSAGPIVVVRDGYLMLGSQPALSHDGVTWSSATIPWLPTS